MVLLIFLLFMNIVTPIWGIYSRVAFISPDVALWGGVYSRAVLNTVNKVYTPVLDYNGLP